MSNLTVEELTQAGDALQQWFISQEIPEHKALAIMGRLSGIFFVKVFSDPNKMLFALETWKTAVDLTATGIAIANRKGLT